MEGTNNTITTNDITNNAIGNNAFSLYLYIDDNNTLKLSGFLDTGNKLKDPYKKRPIILIHSDKIKSSYEDSILVPYKTVSGNGILKCIIVDKIVIDNNHVITNPLIGLSNEKFNIESVNMILNSETIEGGTK